MPWKAKRHKRYTLLTKRKEGGKIGMRNQIMILTNGRIDDNIQLRYRRLSGVFEGGTSTLNK